MELLEKENQRLRSLVESATTAACASTEETQQQGAQVAKAIRGVREPLSVLVRARRAAEESIRQLESQVTSESGSLSRLATRVEAVEAEQAKRTERKDGQLALIEHKFQQWAATLAKVPAIQERVEVALKEVDLRAHDDAQWAYQFTEAATMLDRRVTVLESNSNGNGACDGDGDGYGDNRTLADLAGECVAMSPAQAQVHAQAQAHNAQLASVIARTEEAVALVGERSAGLLQEMQTRMDVFGTEVAAASKRLTEEIHTALLRHRELGARHESVRVELAQASDRAEEMNARGSTQLADIHASLEKVFSPLFSLSSIISSTSLVPSCSIFSFLLISSCFHFLPRLRLAVQCCSSPRRQHLGRFQASQGRSAQNRGQRGSSAAVSTIRVSVLSAASAATAIPGNQHSWPICTISLSLDWPASTSVGGCGCGSEW
jgi:chromosome segregation ATPase